MKKLRFQTRLIIGFSILIFLNSIIVLLAMVQIRKISSETELIYRSPLNVSNSVRDININVNDIHRIMDKIVLQENAANLNKNVRDISHNDSLIAQAFEIVTEKFLGQESTVVDTYNAYNDWAKIRDEAIVLAKAGNFEKAAELSSGELVTQLDYLSDKTTFLTDFAQNKAYELYTHAGNIREKSTLLFLVFMLFVLFISVLASFLISKSISEPIQKYITDLNLIYNKKSSRKGKFLEKSEEEILAHTVIELEAAYKRLENFNIELEKTVLDRTRALKEQNEEYEKLNTEYKTANNELIIAKKLIEASETKLTLINKTKDKFFSIIAHDLKNTFSSLLGFSDLLLENHKIYEEEEHKNIVKIINDSAKSIYSLLENLLTWASSQSDRIEFIPQKLYIKPLLNDVILLLKQSAKIKGIGLENKTEDNLSVYADKNMLNTIFRNLITNAIKFTQKDGSVIVRATESKDKDFIEISFADTGIGIPEERIEKIFHLDENTSTPGTENEIGTGLGLIICKEFLEKNGGNISVESVVDKGSTITVHLPIT